MELMNVNNVMTMTSREIAELTGKNHAHVMRDIRKMLDDLGQNPDLDYAYKSTTYTASTGQSYPQYELNKDLTLTLLTGYDASARYKVVKRWQELEKGVTKPEITFTDKVSGEIALIESYARMLNPAPSSKALMLKKVGENNGLDVSVLPAYEVDAPPSSLLGSSEATAPISKLLKDNGVGYSANEFNIMLKEAGVLTQLVRKDSKGRDRKYWNITTLGLEYGKNITSPHNPRETQPHWYVNKFEELLELVGE